MITIVNYGMGKLGSLPHLFKRIGKYSDSQTYFSPEMIEFSGTYVENLLCNLCDLKSILSGIKYV